MYTFGAKSEARRSGQTAMFIIVDGLARLLAPVLSVTMDELWRMLPGEREASVHMALFPRDLDAVAGRGAARALGGSWRRARSVNLRSKRSGRTRPSPRTCRRAVVHRRRRRRWRAARATIETFLPTLFGVSEVDARDLDDGSTASTASVERADGMKCERCWRYVPEVSAAPDRTGLCPRCVDALAEPVSLLRARVAPPRSSSSPSPWSILDQITKAMVRPALTLHESIEVIPGLLDLTRVHNTGAAFGMLNAVDFPFKTVVLSLVAAIALGGVAWYAATVPLSDRLARVGIAGVLGGAVGNLIDRATSRLRAGFRRCLLERLAFLGVQRRRRRDHGWRRSS